MSELNRSRRVASSSRAGLREPRRGQVAQPTASPQRRRTPTRSSRARRARSRCERTAAEDAILRNRFRALARCNRPVERCRAPLGARHGAATAAVSVIDGRMYFAYGASAQRVDHPVSTRLEALRLAQPVRTRHNAALGTRAGNSPRLTLRAFGEARTRRSRPALQRPPGRRSARCIARNSRRAIQGRHTTSALDRHQDGTRTRAAQGIHSSTSNRPASCSTIVPPSCSTSMIVTARL